MNFAFVTEPTRAIGPMSNFLGLIRAFVQSILYIFTKPTNGLFDLILSEPLFIWGFGLIAVIATVNIVGRLLSRS